MVNDAKTTSSLDGDSSPPSSSAASHSLAMTASAAVATAAAAAPSSSRAVTYASPAVLVEALGFVLNQEGLVGFSTKKNLLMVSKDVCDTTRTSILGLSGDERLFPILGKFGRLGYLSITFGKYSSRAWYQTAGVDLSAVAPLLQYLEILTQEKPEREKSKKKKKKAKKESQSMAEKKKDVEGETGGGGSKLIVLDADEVGEEGVVSAAATAGEGAVQDGDKSAEKRLGKRDLNPRGGRLRKKRKMGAEVSLADSDTKPAAVDTAALKVAQEPCTLLTGLRSLRCLTTIKLTFEREMGIAAERWIEEQLPPSLEELEISGPELLEVGFGPLTRLVRAGKLPRLVCMRFRRISYSGFLQSSSPDMTTRVLIHLLTSLTRVTTPRLQNVHFRDDDMDKDDEDGGWLDQLLCPHPKWKTKTEALRHWAADGERPPHLQNLEVESGAAVPKLLRTGDPQLVELGTLLYASVDGLIHKGELNRECVVAWVDQLEECHFYYARAQAVRALASYVKNDGTYLNPNEYPDLYHRARDLLYELVRVALVAPTGKEGGTPPDRALSFLTRHLLGMISTELESKRTYPLFDVSDVHFEAIAVLAVKVIAFQCPPEENALRDASIVLLRILRQDLPVRGVWEFSMAAMAYRGFRATKEEGKQEVYGNIARYTTFATEGNRTVGSVMMVRLVLRMIFDQSDRSLVKPQVEMLLLLLSQNVALMFEVLRAEGLLASVVAALLHDHRTPSILWICSHLDNPHWVPDFTVDVLLRRTEAPPFKGFGKHLTSVLAASSKRIPSDLPIDPSRYHVDTGRVLILEALLAPERSSAFIAALAADAKQVGSVTLFNLLKEVASRGLLDPGGVSGVLERQQLGEAVDVLKLAADASPEALCVLRALKGVPVDHLYDVLKRIKIAAVKKSGRIRPLKASLFDELIVSLAGLDAVSTSTQTVTSTSSFSKTRADTPLSPLPAAAATASASSHSSSLYPSLCSNLDATLMQLGEKEVVNRLCDFMEKCKVQRKVNMFGVPQGKQQWKVSQLRIVALALSSLTVFSEIFVKMLAGPGTRAFAACQAASGAVVSEAMGATPGNMSEKHGSYQTSSHPPAPRSSEAFLELWIEVIASIENVPVLAFGLARAATKERDVLRGLCKLAANSGSNVGRLARALAMLTTTRARFSHDLSGRGTVIAVGGRTDGEGGGGAAVATSKSEGAPSGKEVEDAESTAKAGNVAAVEHSYIHGALTFGIPAVEPAAIVDCLTAKEGSMDDRSFRLSERIPLLVMSLIAVPAMTAAVLGAEESSFPVVRMLLDYHRTRVTSAGRPSFGSSSSNNKGRLGVGSGRGSSNEFFDKNMADALQKYGLEGGVNVGRAAMSYLMKESTVPELIEYKALRTLRMLTLEEPAFALPHILGTDGFLSVAVRLLVCELLQCRPTFTQACVERSLPELLAFLDRSVEVQTYVSSLEIVLSIMASVPDFLSRIAILLKKEREEKDVVGRVFGAYIQGLVRQWSSDRRMNRGNNKAVIGQITALLRVSEEGEAEDDKVQGEKEEEKEE